MASSFQTQFLAAGLPQLQAAFGETISWTISGGSPAALTACVDRDADARLYGPGGEKQNKSARVTFAAADAVGYSKDDTFTFDSITWKVSEIESENDGVVVMMLAFKNYTARHGEGFRAS